MVEPVASIDYEPSAPAPGRLALVQRFANTVDREHGREVLHSPQALRTLLLDLGLIDRETPVGGRELAAALDLRDRIQSLALANNGLQTDVQLEAELVVRVDDEGAELLPARRDVPGALAELVGIVYTAMADGTWSRLKACRREVCHWLFYDRSRNHSAVWCSMAVCGNRTKTRAYRARRPGPISSRTARRA
jgi:predicted RNA-binding Zn ribbon-like protein